MPIEAIRIPQLGEGLHEALLVEYIRQPGDAVKRDDPLYVLETDKATTEVESSFDGRVVEWLVEPGLVLLIGTEIGRIEVASVDEAQPAPDDSLGELEVRSILSAESGVNGAPSPHSVRAGLRREGHAGSARVPPRTRKHLQILGLMDRVDDIPMQGSKMMPEDVDRFVSETLASDGVDVLSRVEENRDKSGTLQPSNFNETAIPRRQLTLNYRLQRGLHQVVPATAIVEVDWSGLAAAREENRAESGPTGFMMMLWCVAQSLKRFPKFRSTLVSNGRVLRTYEHIYLGIAVALPDDTIVTAVVPEADTFSPPDFWQVAEERVAAARQGCDQIDERVTLTVSNIGPFGLDMGLPVVVPPTVATMGLGRIAQKPVPEGESFRFVPSASLALTFDHRIVNGLGAGQFLTDLKLQVDNFSWQNLIGAYR